MSSSRPKHTSLDNDEKPEVGQLKLYIKRFSHRFNLSTFSNHEKARLIAALLQNDTAYAKAVLYEPIKRAYPFIEKTPQALIDVLTLTPEDSKHGDLNDSVLNLIQVLLSYNANIDNVLILQNAMQQIPDNKIPIQTKRLFAHLISSRLYSCIDNYSYVPPLVLMNKNKYSGDITIDQYEAITNSKSLDSSEFIICTLGVLQRLIKDNPEAVKALNEIRQLYDKLEYENAINALLLFSNTTFAEVLSDPLKKMINDAHEKFTMKVVLSENYTRRFYENRVAQLGIHELDLEKINKVSSPITGVTADELKHVSDVVLAVMFDIDTEDRMLERMHELKRGSSRLQTRSKQRKPGFVSIRDEYKENNSAAVFSKNRGVMVSNQPNFTDETTEENLRNKIVEKNIAGYRDDAMDKSNFASYVGSTSGHALNLVADLEEYMKYHADDPSLQRDMNEYLKAFILINVYYGYHSAREIMECFDEPHIKEIFSKFNAQLNLEWSPKVVEQAMRDTQAYTAAICLKKALGTELQSMRSMFTEKSNIRPSDVRNQKTATHESKHTPPKPGMG